MQSDSAQPSTHQYTSPPGSTSGIPSPLLRSAHEPHAIQPDCQRGLFPRLPLACPDPKGVVSKPSFFFPFVVDSRPLYRLRYASWAGADLVSFGGPTADGPPVLYATLDVTATCRVCHLPFHDAQFHFGAKNVGCQTDRCLTPLIAQPWSLPGNDRISFILRAVPHIVIAARRATVLNHPPQCIVELWDRIQVAGNR